MTTSRITRRRFFKEAGAFVAVGALAPLVGVKSPGRPGPVGVGGATFGFPYTRGESPNIGATLALGAIAQVDVDEAVITMGSRPSTLVFVSPVTAMWKEEPTTLASFQIGDVVVAEGWKARTGFHAATLAPLYQGMDATVLELARSEVLTEYGPVTFSPRTLDEETLSPIEPQRLAVGSRFLANVRKNAATGEVWAYRILVPTAS